MIPITNIWTTRTITHHDIAQVAKGAQEQVRHKVEEHTDMSICDKTVDTLLHARLKQTALSLVHEMSRCTAIMELELEKPLGERNQKQIKHNSDSIKETQQKLNELMGDKTLEFGREDTRAVVGPGSYLILRTQSKLNPIGIPLHGISDSDTQSEILPTFRSVNDIGVENVQQIRKSEHIRCGGKIYSLKFGERNLPEVSFNLPDIDWTMLQVKLACLWYKHEKLFQPVQVWSSEQSFVASSSTLSTGSVHRQIHQPVAQFVPVSPGSIPTFESTENIGFKNIKQIRRSDQIICGGTKYRLEFDRHNMPTIICDNPNRFSNMVQFKLFKLWHAHQEHFVPDQSDSSIPTTTTLPSSLAETENRQDIVAEIIPPVPTTLKPGSETESPSLRGSVTMPTFESESVIVFNHIQQIRNSGQLSCKGKVHRIDFNSQNKPRVLGDGHDQDSLLLENRLVRLWNAFPEEFVQTQLPQAEQIGAVSLSLPTNGPAQPDHHSIAPPRVEIIASGIINTNEPLPIPTIPSAGAIYDEHFEQIQISRQLNCNGKTYRVEIHERNEPIVIVEKPDPYAEIIQTRLSVAWIKFQARISLELLAKIDTAGDTLRLPAMFPEIETDAFRLRTNLGLETDWHAAAKTAQDSFTKIVRQFQKRVTAKKNQIVEKFEQLSQGSLRASIQRETLHNAQTKMNALSVMQDTLTRNIDRFKEMHHRLFEMARLCTNPLMQQIFLNRIKFFNEHLNTISTTDLNPEAAKEWESVLQNQSVFLKNFDQPQFLLCSALLFDSSEVTLRDRTKVPVPKKTALAPTRQILVDLLTDSGSSWQIIQEAQEKLQREQDKLIKAFVIKLNAGLDLDNAFLDFMGRHGEGLDPETGRSFYVPETYSRIVSLKEIRAELNNRNEHLPEEIVAKKVNECREHIAQIQRETRSMQLYERSEDFLGHRTYITDRNTNRTEMNFSQWCNELKNKSSFIES